MAASFRKIALSTLAAVTLAASTEARPRFHRGHGIGLGTVGALPSAG